MPLFSRFRRRKSTPKDGMVHPCTGILQGATDIVMNNPTMMDRPTFIQGFMDGRTVLQILAERMTPGADIDSSERDPPPRCHPGTREWLTASIQEWLMNEDRERDYLWLYGAAGVGKSAVAQTIAEYAAEHERLGAAFFFSQTGGRSDYARVWITIAYQLAVRIPQYQALVARQLAADPDILNKAPHVQFKRLIAEPLSSLPPSSKVLIVLDGLDECKTEDAQLNIIELISNVRHSTLSLPVVWMVCSRPEYHLKQRFFDNDFPIDCWKKELPVDSEEAKDDVKLFIRQSFERIRRKYFDIVGESWPPDECLQEVIEDTSGLFALASAVVRYVGDPEYADPEDRLQAATCWLCKLDPADRENPMATLDHLYTHILSEIPQDILPTTIQIIHSSPTILFGYPAAVLANFYDISRGDFYRSLRKLYSFLDVPSPGDAIKTPIKFFHKSFSDYLSSPDRSGRFYRTKGAIACDTLRNFSRLTSRALRSQGGVNPGPDFPLSWAPSGPGGEMSVNEELCAYCTVTAVLDGARFAPADEDALRAFYDFDYNLLAGIQCYGQHSVHGKNVRLLNWLLCQWVTEEPQGQKLPDTARIEPIYDTDRKLLKMLHAQVPDARPMPLSFAKELIPEEVDPPYYLFLGHGSGAVLGVCRGWDKVDLHSTEFPPAIELVSQHE